ncbi:hypothetical protein B0H16DRAFT_1511415 [Mycena metata]|uniref:Uncharacterized protein n=1 Tax=Mycena metata TaxID=1033252 RepID=A0AAD7JYL7_9AGAR|nr:hypothetical protein B0H16DRAFT_1511415 [Mycena metata]
MGSFGIFFQVLSEHMKEEVLETFKIEACSISVGEAATESLPHVQNLIVTAKRLIFVNGEGTAVFQKAYKFAPEVVVKNALDILIISSRANVHDDFDTYLQFPQGEATKAMSCIQAACAKIPRQLATKVFAVDANLHARPLNILCPSHRDFIRSVNQIFSALAYEDCGRVLAPIVNFQVSLMAEPTTGAIQYIEQLFREKPPPVVLLWDYDEKVSSAGITYTEGTWDPLPRGFDASTLIQTAVSSFCHHGGNGSHATIQAHIYLNYSLFHHHIAAYDARNLQSLQATTCGVKISVTHECAHYAVTTNPAINNTLPRGLAIGGGNRVFKECVNLKTGTLEAGLVVERLWLGKLYGLAYDIDGQLAVFFTSSDRRLAEREREDNPPIVCQDPEIKADAEEEEDKYKPDRDEEAAFAAPDNAPTTVWLEAPDIVARFSNEHLPLFPAGTISTSSLVPRSVQQRASPSPSPPPTPTPIEVLKNTSYPRSIPPDTPTPKTKRKVLVGKTSVRNDCVVRDVS